MGFESSLSRVLSTRKTSHRKVLSVLQSQEGALCPVSSPVNLQWILLSPVDSLELGGSLSSVDSLELAIGLGVSSLDYLVGIVSGNGAAQVGSC